MSSGVTQQQEVELEFALRLPFPPESPPAIVPPLCGVRCAVTVTNRPPCRAFLELLSFSFPTVPSRRRGSSAHSTEEETEA